MVTRITKEFRFDAAHQLPRHNGKCRNLHGHTYTIRVTVEGEPKGLTGESDEGMVIDFGELSSVWKELEPYLDHRFLNESIPALQGTTTAERLAAWLFDQFALNLPSVSVYDVTVFETPTSWATYIGGE